MVRNNTLDQLFLVNTRKGTKMKPEYTKIQKIESKVSKMEPKDVKSEPTGGQRSSKGAKKGANGRQMEPKGSQRWSKRQSKTIPEWTIGKRSHKNMHFLNQHFKNMDLGAFWGHFWGSFRCIFSLN